MKDISVKTRCTSIGIFTCGIIGLVAGGPAGGIFLGYLGFMLGTGVGLIVENTCYPEEKCSKSPVIERKPPSRRLSMSDGEPRIAATFLHNTARIIQELDLEIGKNNV